MSKSLQASAAEVKASVRRSIETRDLRAATALIEALGAAAPRARRRTHGLPVDDRSASVRRPR